MESKVTRDDKTGDIHITVNVSNNLTNTSNSSAENTNENDFDNTRPKSKSFTLQLLEGAAILGTAALASGFF